jgi:hypothetical protein
MDTHNDEWDRCVAEALHHSCIHTHTHLQACIYTHTGTCTRTHMYKRAHAHAQTLLMGRSCGGHRVVSSFILRPDAGPAGAAGAAQGAQAEHSSWWTLTRLQARACAPLCQRTQAQADQRGGCRSGLHFVYQGDLSADADAGGRANPLALLPDAAPGRRTQRGTHNAAPARVADPTGRSTCTAHVPPRRARGRRRRRGDPGRGVHAVGGAPGGHLRPALGLSARPARRVRHPRCAVLPLPPPLPMLAPATRARARPDPEGGMATQSAWC